MIVKLAIIVLLVWVAMAALTALYASAKRYPWFPIFVAALTPVGLPVALILLALAPEKPGSWQEELEFVPGDDRLTPAR